MKKTAIIAGAIFFCLSATVNAQQPDSTKQQPAVAPQTTMPATTETAVPATTTTTTTAITANGTTPYGADKWNNWDSKTKYAMLPMPEALTTEKIFPVIGKYDLTDQAGTHSQVTVALDESNKGIAWVDGLPQGKTEIYLRKSPAVYKIPAQKSADGKDLAQGVLIYDKDANTLNVCTGCTFNNDDPASVFLPAPVATEEPVAKHTKKGKTVKVKEVKVKPVFYTGTKELQEQQPASTQTTAPVTTPAPQQ